MAKKYFSIINNGTEDLEVKDAEARSAIEQIGALDDATEQTHGLMSAADKTKLDSIATGAEVNVQSDWNATSGDAQILNKPTLGTAAAKGVAEGVNTSTNLVQSNHVKTYVDNATGAINELIPTQATSSNQLADKSFVNSSVATATAEYKGNFNLVSDLELTTAATHSDIATALGTAVTTADDNDYCYVQIPTATTTPTQIAKVERYKYSSNAWAYEYELNNSGFTADQWAALNSSITSGLVSKLSALPTNSELNTALGGKVNTSDVVTTVDTSSKLPTSGAVKTYVDTSASQIPAYGVCETSASTQVKVVTLYNRNFLLKNGAMVAVYFRYGNTCALPIRLNVAGTGVKEVGLMYSYDMEVMFQSQTDVALMSNSLALFVYNEHEACYTMLGYKSGDATVLATGTDTDMRVWSAKQIADYFSSRVTDDLLHPVDISTLTPSSTFQKGDVLGINGVIYRCNTATSDFPVTLAVEGGAFVTHTVNGKIAFVVTDPTVDSDWVVWTDAAIEYWTTQLDARTTALETAEAALEAANTALAGRVTTLEGITGVVVSGDNTYTMRQLLEAMATLMTKNIVTQP